MMQSTIFKIFMIIEITNRLKKDRKIKCHYREIVVTFESHDGVDTFMDGFFTFFYFFV